MTTVLQTDAVAEAMAAERAAMAEYHALLDYSPNVAELEDHVVTNLASEELVDPSPNVAGLVDHVMASFTAEGCVDNSPHVKDVPLDRSRIAALAFQTLDTNGDGVISPIELVRWLKSVTGTENAVDMLTLFGQMDTDGDGQLTQEELQAALSSTDDGHVLKWLAGLEKSLQVQTEEEQGIHEVSKPTPSTKQGLDKENVTQGNYCQTATTAPTSCDIEFHVRRVATPLKGGGDKKVSPNACRATSSRAKSPTKAGEQMEQNAKSATCKMSSADMEMCAVEAKRREVQMQLAANKRRVERTTQTRTEIIHTDVYVQKTPPSRSPLSEVSSNAIQPRQSTVAKPHSAQPVAAVESNAQRLQRSPSPRLARRAPSPRLPRAVSPRLASPAQQGAKLPATKMSTLELEMLAVERKRDEVHRMREANKRRMQRSTLVADTLSANDAM